MGNKKLSKSDAQKNNEIEKTLIYRRLALISMNNFEWINLPDSIKPRYIERSLFYNGIAAFAYTEKYGYIVLPLTYTGDLDLYYEPQKWNVIGNGYIKNLDKIDSVVIRNNQFCVPSNYDTLWYAEKIANVERTIAVNVNIHKVPWLFKGTTNQVLTLKNIYDQVERNEPVVYVDNNLQTNKAFEVFNTNAPYLIDKLSAYKKELISEYLELYGYPTTQAEKNERLTMTESEVKVEFSDSGYVGAMYEYRKQACEEINKMFGLNIDVKINRYRQKSEEFYELEKMKLGQQMPNGGDNNG